MKKNLKYILVVRGCDDINKACIEFVDENEKNNFIFYARHLNSKCESCCQPTIHLFYGDSKFFSNLSVDTLFDYRELDLIGGYF